MLAKQGVHLGMPVYMLLSRQHCVIPLRGCSGEEVRDRAAPRSPKRAEPRKATAPPTLTAMGAHPRGAKNSSITSCRGLLNASSMRTRVAVLAPADCAHRTPREASSSGPRATVSFSST